MTKSRFDILDPVTARLAPVNRTGSPGTGPAPDTCPGPLAGVVRGTGSPDLATALSRSSGGQLTRVGSSLLQLQRHYGNGYVQGVIGRAAPVIQAKLMVGAPGDRYEREADSVARRLGAQRLAGPPTVSRTGEGTRARPELEASVGRARGGGQSLASHVLEPMERAFGAGFGRVRVHQDPQSDQLCRTIAARAFTVGDHIFARNGERVGEGGHLLAHELTHVIQQRRAAGSPDTIQAFWVRRPGGGYRWVSDQTKKQRYIRTAQKRSTFQYPLKRAVYVDPWAPGMQLGVDSQLGFTPEEQAELEIAVVTDLKTIRRTDVGARLLRMLATEVTGSTTIQPQAGIRGPVTQTERTRTGLSSTVILTPGQLDAAEELANQGIRVRETPWNPSPSDVVLFHELLHAYHNLNGTRVTGLVTAEQARHPGDVGELLSEYQVVGLNTMDGDEDHQFGLEYFTENTYRDQTGRPHRSTYTPLRKAAKKKKK